MIQAQKYESIKSMKFEHVCTSSVKNRSPNEQNIALLYQTDAGVKVLDSQNKVLELTGDENVEESSKIGASSNCLVYQLAQQQLQQEMSGFRKNGLYVLDFEKGLLKQMDTSTRSSAISSIAKDEGDKMNKKWKFSKKIKFDESNKNERQFEVFGDQVLTHNCKNSFFFGKFDSTDSQNTDIQLEEVKIGEVEGQQEQEKDKKIKRISTQIILTRFLSKDLIFILEQFGAYHIYDKSSKTLKSFNKSKNSKPRGFISIQIDHQNEVLYLLFKTRLYVMSFSSGKLAIVNRISSEKSRKSKRQKKIKESSQDIDSSSSTESIKKELHFCNIALIPFSSYSTHILFLVKSDGKIASYYLCPLSSKLVTCFEPEIDTKLGEVKTCQMGLFGDQVMVVTGDFGVASFNPWV